MTTAHMREERRWRRELRRQDLRAAAMAAGPHLLEDNLTLVIPSAWYNKDAALFWRQHGFSHCRAGAMWTRDTEKPFGGKTYTAEAWLESTRREFYQFWPTLLKYCATCGQEFAPSSSYQLLCSDCEKHHTGNWR